MKELDQLKMLSESIARLEEAGYPMTWSIYHQDGSDELRGDYSTNVPDGVYMVAFPYIDTVGTAKGVTVKNGQFVPEPTLKAIGKARDDAGYWGNFVEHMEYNKEHNAFIVTIGS